MQFPHMFLQVKVTTETFTTYVACEWFLIIMRVHVKGQVVDLKKGELQSVIVDNFEWAL